MAINLTTSSSQETSHHYEFSAQADQPEFLKLFPSVCSSQFDSREAEGRTLNSTTILVATRLD